MRRSEADCRRVRGLVDGSKLAGYNRSRIGVHAERSEIDVKRWWKLANETGKRYSCKKCSSEFVVTRGGDGSIMCCGEPMSKKS